MSSATNATVEFTSNPFTSGPVPAISAAEQASNVSSWKTQDLFSMVIPPNQVAASSTTHASLAPASPGLAKSLSTTKAYPHVIPWDIVSSTSGSTAGATGPPPSRSPPGQHLSARAKAGIVTSALLFFGASCLLGFVLFRQYQALRRKQIADGRTAGEGGNGATRTDLPRIFELEGEGSRR